MSGLSRASCPPSPRPCGELDGQPLPQCPDLRKVMDQRAFMEQVCECRDNGYLPSSKKIGSGDFSKVYLAYATQERIQHNSKLASDLRGKRHTMVAIKMVSTAEASVEFSCKFLPREISSLNATYKHLNVVQLYETYQNSWRAYLVLELAARGDLLEHINAVSDHCRCPGLEQEARRLFWQLVNFGSAHRSGLKNSLLSTFGGSVAYTALEGLTSKKYSGGQADPWSLVPGPDPRPAPAAPASAPGPAAGGRTPLDAARRACALPAQCSAASLQVLHAHQCGQAGGSSAPHVTLPLRSVAEKPEESQLPTSPDNVQPSADSDPPRPLLHLRRPQQQGTPPPLRAPLVRRPSPGSLPRDEVRL
eukprot:bmy_07575T0